MSDGARGRGGLVVELVEVLSRTRALLARPENDFLWSSWLGPEEAVAELELWITALEGGVAPGGDLEVLFAPTGPIQEVGMSSGWGDEFLQLASRFDDVMGRWGPSDDRR